MHKRIAFGNTCSAWNHLKITNIRVDIRRGYFYSRTKKHCVQFLRQKNSRNKVTGMVGLSRLELPTSRLSGACSNQLSYNPEYGGDKRIRTADPLLAKQVLYQLSYTPESLAVSVYRQLIKNSIAEKICQRIFYYLTIFLRRRRFLENHIPIYAFTTLLRASAFLEYCLFETSRFLRPIQYALMS